MSGQMIHLIQIQASVVSVQEDKEALQNSVATRTWNTMVLSPDAQI